MRKIDPHRYRVAIFGSARIKAADPTHKIIYTLAKMIAAEGIDLVTGGGPGLMDAASRGHHAGRKGKKLNLIGLAIDLPKEQKDSYHLDIKREHSLFSTRLDEFMQLSNAVVVAPGGIGTLLELFYTWQLIQTKFICDTPIILMGSHYKGLLDWIREHLLKRKLMSKGDFDLIFHVRTSQQAMKIIRDFHEHYDHDRKTCSTYKQYQK